jgi:hypothetical protein
MMYVLVVSLDLVWSRPHKNCPLGQERESLLAMLGFGANNKNLLPIESRIAQIYLSSNAITINGDSVTYPRKPIAGITLPHKRLRWRRHSRPQGREDLDATTQVWQAPAQRHGATMLVQQHRRNDVVSHVQYLVVLAHVHRMDVVRAPVQQSSGRRSSWAGNPAVQRRPVCGVSSNLLAQLQTWEWSQEEERKRGGA